MGLVSSPSPDGRASDVRHLNAGIQPQISSLLVPFEPATGVILALRAQVSRKSAKELLWPLCPRGAQEVQNRVANALKSITVGDKMITCHSLTPDEVF